MRLICNYFIIVICFLGLNKMGILSDSFISFLEPLFVVGIIFVLIVVSVSYTMGFLRIGN